MRPTSIAALLLLIPPISACSRATAQVGSGLSKPPSSIIDAAATHLSPEWKETVTFLLDHGLGDPRTGVYRHAKIVFPSLISDGSQRPVDVTGWALPNGDFVAWNGLLYRPESLGEKADLAEDLKNPSLRDGFYEPRMSPASAVGACLLFIAGQTEWAEKVASRLESQGLRDSPFSAVVDYAAARFERGVLAHMYGADSLAASEARWIVAQRPALQALARARPTSEYRLRSFEFLEPAERLLEDSERRLKKEKPSISGNQIFILIQNLDQVKARQMSQPGGVNLAEDPIVAGLIAVGRPAVPKLLDCMATDTRLTRSVSFARSFFPARNLIPVRSAAYAAFCGIFEKYAFSDDPGREPTVEELRQWWEANKDRSNPEIWVATLADDHASPRQWLEAAQRLTQSISVQPLSPFSARASTPPSPTMKGEPMRGKGHPSVTELMARRAVQVSETGAPSSSDRLFYWSESESIVEALTRWEPKAVPEVAKRLAARADALWNEEGFRNEWISYVGMRADRLQKIRVKLGDSSGTTAYRKWIALVPDADKARWKAFERDLP